MELTYKILGGDGKEYGPVTAEQFRAWTQEGRVGGDTQVWRSDLSEWRTAASLPELGFAATPPVSHEAAGASLPAGLGTQLDQRIKSGASWFYWIAAMSLINSFLAMTKQSWGFAIGLGITRQIDFELSNTPMVAFGIDLIAIGAIALFGFFAIKHHAWAFIIGLVLLALDTALTVIQQAWISVAFHAWAIFSIFSAFRISRALRR